MDMQTQILQFKGEKYEIKMQFMHGSISYSTATFGCHFRFHIFFHNRILGGCTLFLQLDINGYQVLTGKTNCRLSLSQLAVLRLLWNFFVRVLNSPPALYQTGFKRIHLLNSAHVIQCRAIMAVFHMAAIGFALTLCVCVHV